MRVLRCLPFLVLLGAASAPAQAPAQAHRYAIDASRSTVSAKVAFFGLASKTAGFPRVTGGITLDAARPERIDLAVVLDATALTAPDPVTLGRLKGPKFFDTARYPTVRFDGSTMRMTGDREAVVAGTITARGVTRPATLAVRFAAPPLRATGRAPLLIDAATEIDRRDFGMTAYPFIVGRTVAITIRATLVPG